jgi:hypothetical protein
MATPGELQSFTTREAALSLLFDLIRRNGEIDRHHLRIVCELAELPARTRAAFFCGTATRPVREIGRHRGQRRVRTSIYETNCYCGCSLCNGGHSRASATVIGRKSETSPPP